MWNPGGGSSAAEPAGGAEVGRAGGAEVGRAGGVEVGRAGGDEVGREAGGDDADPGRATDRPLSFSWRSRPATSTARAAASTANPDRKSTRLNSSHVKISYAVF